MPDSPGTKQRKRKEAAGKFPKPRGKAPKGSNGPPQEWDKENGGWHDARSLVLETSSWPVDSEQCDPSSSVAVIPVALEGQRTDDATLDAPQAAQAAMLQAATTPPAEQREVAQQAVAPQTVGPQYIAPQVVAPQAVAPQQEITQEALGFVPPIGSSPSLQYTATWTGWVFVPPNTPAASHFELYNHCRVITPLDSGPHGIQLLVAVPILANPAVWPIEPLPFTQAAVLSSAPVLAQPHQAAAAPASISAALPTAAPSAAAAPSVATAAPSVATAAPHPSALPPPPSRRKPTGPVPAAPCGTPCTWDTEEGCWRRPDGSEHTILRNKKRVAEGKEREAACESIDAEARRRLMLSDEPANEQETQLFPQSASGLLDSERCLELGRRSRSRLELLADHRLRFNPPSPGSRCPLSWQCRGQVLVRAVDCTRCRGRQIPPEMKDLDHVLNNPITRSDAYWAHVNELLTDYDSLTREQFEAHLRSVMELQLLEVDQEHSRLWDEHNQSIAKQERMRLQEAWKREQIEENEFYRRKAERKRQADLKQTENEDAQMVDQMQSRAHGMQGSVCVGVALRPQIDYSCFTHDFHLHGDDLSRTYVHNVRLRLRVFTAAPES